MKKLLFLSALLLAACAPQTSHNSSTHGMTMDDMVVELAGKTGDDFDRAFLEQMIPHHQGAIDMAQAAKKSAKHAEIQRMADEIITAQQREIDQMRAWQKAWGYTE